MTDKIKMVTILIEASTLLPDSLRFESEPYWKGWRLVKNLDGYGLERKILEAGWNFFYMAAEINKSVFGFNVEKATHRAIKRVLANLKSEKFNSLEITHSEQKRPKKSLPTRHHPPCSRLVWFYLDLIPG